MSDTVKVDLEENSRYRVALELTLHIASFEGDPSKGTEREYFLRLYRQSYDAVYGYKNIDEVVGGKGSSARASLSY